MTRRSGTKTTQSYSAASRAEKHPLSRVRFFVYLTVSALVLAGAALATVYFLPPDDTLPTTDLYDATSATSAPATDSIVAPLATSIPPTEPSEEVAVQNQLRSWFATVSGVTNVHSLDIDMPADEPPLVYVEIDVRPGYNNQRLPETFVAKLNEVLGVTRYSDLVVIIDDGELMIEYTFDSENTVWHETLLTSNALSLSQSRS